MSHAIAIKPTQEIAVNPSLSNREWTVIAGGLAVSAAVIIGVTASRPVTAPKISKPKLLLIGTASAIPAMYLISWAQEKWAR